MLRATTARPLQQLAEDAGADASEAQPVQDPHGPADPSTRDAPEGAIMIADA